MKNLDWCIYTYRHRRMFVYIAEKLIKNEKDRIAILERAKWHDIDKMLMYMFLDQDFSQKSHVLIKPHHLECKCEKTYLDYLETVIDYESAPYTKPDKPLNAFDFLNKLVDMGLVKKEEAKILFDIMHDLGIDYSYNVLEDVTGMEFALSIGEVTEEMILLEIFKYINDNPDNELLWVMEHM